MVESYIPQSTLECIQNQEIRLCGVRSLEAFLKAVLNDSCKMFKLDITSLSLVDRDFEVRRALHTEEIGIGDYPNLYFLEDADCQRLEKMELPYLGPFNTDWHSFLFGEQPLTSRIALLSLQNYRGIYGCLAFGSNDPSRFTSAVEKSLLHHFSKIAVVCLDNVLNHERLRFAGLTDPLTRINNRLFFDQRLKEEIAHAARSGTPLSCLCLDIDDFKKVNDQHGHSVGDEVLIQVACLIKGQLRVGDVVARYGGEEFVVLLPTATSVHAEQVAQRICYTVGNCPLFTKTGNAIPVTLSVGNSTFAPIQKGKVKPNCKVPLLDIADKALLQAKANGKNQVVTIPLELE